MTIPTHINAPGNTVTTPFGPLHTGSIAATSLGRLVPRTMRKTTHTLLRESSTSMCQFLRLQKSSSDTIRSSRLRTITNAFLTVVPASPTGISVGPRRRSHGVVRTRRRPALEHGMEVSTSSTRKLMGKDIVKHMPRSTIVMLAIQTGCKAGQTPRSPGVVTMMTSTEDVSNIIASTDIRMNGQVARAIGVAKLSRGDAR